MNEEKKIIIDEDWKSQVEAEQQAAAQQTPSEPPTEVGEVSEQAPTTPVDGSPTDSEADASADDPKMPPASFGMLMSSLATEALLSMGQFPHPATGEVSKRPNQAQYLIDTLDILKKKTIGNLTPEETDALDDVLHQLRMAFIASR